MYSIRRNLLTIVLAMASIFSMSVMNQASAATAEDLDKDSQQALQTLYKTEPLAEKLSRTAKAVLVFPNMVKAGLVFGGSYGEGELLKGSKVIDYYNSVSGSWGLQIGAQSYGYAMFLMTDAAVRYVERRRVGKLASVRLLLWWTKESQRIFRHPRCRMMPTRLFSVSKD